jgi:hypothetical protein
MPATRRGLDTSSRLVRNSSGDAIALWRCPRCRREAFSWGHGLTRCRGCAVWLDVQPSAADEETTPVMPPWEET